MNDISEDEHAAKLDEALARSQREEREERNADLERQQRADEQIVQALSDPPGGSAS